MPKVISVTFHIKIYEAVLLNGLLVFVNTHNIKKCFKYKMKLVIDLYIT